MDALTKTDVNSEGTIVISIMSRIVSLLVMSPWYVCKFSLVCFYTLPVSFFFVFSTIVINPSILSSQRRDLFQLIFDHYDKLFQYSISITVAVSFIVMIMSPLKYALASVSQVLLSRFNK